MYVKLLAQYLVLLLIVIGYINYTFYTLVFGKTYLKCIQIMLLRMF